MHDRPFSNTPSYSLLFSFEDEDDDAMPTLNTNHILKLVESSVPAALQTWVCKMVTLSLGICIYKRTVLRVGKTNIFYFTGVIQLHKFINGSILHFCQDILANFIHTLQIVGILYRAILLAITHTFYLKWQLRLGYIND